MRQRKYETKTTTYGEDVPVCPHCEHRWSEEPHPDELDRSGETEMQCPKCGGGFLLEVEYRAEYTTYAERKVGK